MSKRAYKIIFAAGGTGGHLFPAQALAQQLIEKEPGLDLIFAGAKLSENIYLDKKKFAFREIASTTPLRGNIFKAFKSIGTLLKGVRESLSLLREHPPDLVVGFGSFHAFPILCAAVIKKIPLVLFESNSIPGKVIRLFSKKALVTAIYLPDAKEYLKGKIVEVEIPLKNLESRQLIPQEEARLWMHLNLRLPTLLVFGGSQGAKAINQLVLELLPVLKKVFHPFQWIHFTGCEETAQQITRLCESLDIPCYVKKFESQMNIAWSAADLAICRSGAMTLSELMHYEVPAILIPYPQAADQHQLKNALFLEQKVGGAVHFTENTLSLEILIETICRLAGLKSPERLKMKKSLENFKTRQKKKELDKLIVEILEDICEN